MNSINAAFRGLASIKATRKGKDSLVDDAINQLSSIPILLEFPAASPATFSRLAELLRAQLLPLYHASLSLSLDYVVAVLQFIHHNKVIPALNAGNAIHVWESLLSSLFSGILDFLDEKSNTKHREIIASVLHPVFCSLYFDQSPGSLFSKFSGDMLSVVYQLLMATIECNGRSAAKLRDHDIGSKCLGLTIRQTKDFLALEAILDLFGSIIPLVKGGREKRSHYIKEVFSSSIFECSDLVVEHLEHISSPDWSITSMKIIKTLADWDLSFPQPFDATSLVLRDVPFFNASFSFYVDKTRFTANLEKDGEVETLCIPFTTVLEIAVSVTSNDDVHVTIHITSPPTLGGALMSTISTGNLSVSWKLKKVLMHRFGKALKSRNLSIGHPASKKLSKAKEIALDFDPKGQDHMKGCRVYLNGNSPRVTNSVTLTSPLVPPSIKKSFSALPITAANFNSRELSIAPESHKPTVFLDGHGNLSHNPPSGQQNNIFNSHTGNVASESSYWNVVVVDNDGSDGDIPRFKSKARKRAIVISDDEGADKEKEMRLQQTKLRQQVQLQVIAPEHFSPSPSHDLPQDVESQVIEEVSQKKQGRHTKLDNKPNTSPPNEGLAASNKRPVWDIEDDDETRDDEERPAKRKRQEPAVVGPNIARTYQAKKYGRKGWNSSPLLSIAHTVDFDEVPGPKQEVTLPPRPKPRASAMKSKTGKPGSTAKPAPVKKADAKKRENHPRVAKEMASRKLRDDPDITLVNPKDVALDSQDVIVKEIDIKNIRRAKGEITDRTPNGIEPIIGCIPNQQPRKPVKAPWEAEDFIEMIKHSSDPLEAQIQDLSESTSDSAIPPDEQPIAVKEVASEDCYLDTVEPTKLGSSSDDDHETQEVIMVDLTLDDSPPPPRKVNGNSTKPSDQKNRKALSAQVHPEAEWMQKAFAPAVIQVPPPILKQNATMHPPEGKVALASSAPRVGEKAPKPAMFNLSPPTEKVERMIIPPSQMPFDNKLREGPMVKFASPFKADASFNTGNKFRDEGVRRPRISFASPGQEAMRKKGRLGHASGNQRSRNTVPEFKIEEDPMDRIVEVLNDINEALIHKITHRFDAVTENLHLGQRIILEGTADTLQEMCHQSVRHFNDLVDLEEEYSSHCVKIDQGFNDFRKTGEQLSHCFKAVTVDFSRRSLAKKFPSTLSGKTPTVILNPTLRL
ncbi:hypothetical protein M413DRAFT_21153 [Hebeloma cylindrosporum]|uniref:Uncharacterized protein n=1 Tax=Hebeloma cylindrosporum TaxID=76867 RepID=A0A0C2Z6P4_HEBCY|nr:hypothetical protein M413DRAFT_21153 [Hebeloma cylindrosporum h7]